jgi:Putative beta-barrel porin 2
MNPRLSRHTPFRVLWLLLTAAMPAAAQTTPTLPATAPIRSGPVSLYPTITIRDVGIDSNVFNQSDLAERDDFTFTVSPRLLAALRFGSTRLISTASSDFVFYRIYKDQQSVNGGLEGRFEVMAPHRLRPFVSAARLRSRERKGFEIDQRAQRSETNLMAGLDIDLSSITSLTGWGQHLDFSYAQGEEFLGVGLADALGHTSNLAAAGVKLSVTPLTTITVVAEVSQDRFKSSPLRNSDSLRVAPSVEFAADAAITGRASAGFRQFTPLDSRLPAYRGLVASAGVGFNLLGVTQFDMEANRDVLYSFSDSEPYYLAVGGRVSIAQRILGPVDLIVVGNRQQLQYQSVGGARLAGRRDTTTTVGAGLGFHFGESLHLTLTYDRTQRKSSEPGHREYARRRLLGSVNYGL